MNALDTKIMKAGGSFEIMVKKMRDFLPHVRNDANKRGELISELKSTNLTDEEIFKGVNDNDIIGEIVKYFDKVLETIQTLANPQMGVKEECNLNQLLKGESDFVKLFWKCYHVKEREPEFKISDH